MDKRKMLMLLKDAITASGHEDVKLLKKEETGLSEDVLITLHTGFGLTYGEVQGEFWFDFFPSEEGSDEGISTFSVRILFSTRVSEEDVVPLCVEMGLINSQIPMGAFSYDPITGAAAYRFNLFLVPALSEEEILEEADSCIALCLSCAQQYAAQIQEIIGD